MSNIQELRRNNPAITRIHIDLQSHETSDVALAQALEQNPFITDIDLNFGRVQRTDWSSLLRVIAMRANLEKVKLQVIWRWRWPVVSWPRPRVPASLFLVFLQAIQQNTAIRVVYLQGVRFSIDTISTFVNTASSITSFSLNHCDMDPAEQQQGIQSLVAALQCNTNIKHLKLSGLKDIYIIPILEGLQSNTSVKAFIFSPFSGFSSPISDVTSRALQQLLESTTSIQRFELHHTAFIDPQPFRPIAQGIINSECLSELKFFLCIFRSHQSFHSLQSILQDKQNLTSLSLDTCCFRSREVHRDIISLLLRPDSPLQCFEFQSRDRDLEEVFPGIHFKNLLQAIQTSKLERFSIGTIWTQQQLQTLMQSIPSMHIRELEVVFVRQFWRDGNSRQNPLQAVKNNFSLRSLKGKILKPFPEGRNLFESAEDKQRLAFYFNRNESLDQWVDHPETVEQRKLWPDALGLAERAGPSALFRGLRSILESDHGSFPFPGKRKRKRPQYYTPT